MGINWRCAMPMLSTLAALVIIVHSAEEDVNLDYLLEPQKTLEAEKHNSEQPWTAMDAESLVKQTIPPGSLDYSPDDTSLRRRPGRKRKRRPLSPVVEPEGRTMPHKEHYGEADAINYKPRRRKRPANTQNNRGNIMEVEADTKRNGMLHRRKRPIIEPKPQIADFDNYSFEIEDMTNIEPTSKNNTSNKQMYTDYDGQTDYSNKDIEKGNSEEDLVDKKSAEKDDQVQLQNIEKEQYTLSQTKGDASLSDFSMEARGRGRNWDNDNFGDTLELSASNIPNTYKLNEVKNGPIDPMALKEILKKSNGRSLSEILQQHNLSLADLLHGRENAITLLNADESTVSIAKPANKNTEVNSINEANIELSTAVDITSTTTKLINETNAEIKLNVDLIRPDTSNRTRNQMQNNSLTLREKNSSGLLRPKIFPSGIRRRLRMKPVGSLKSQLNTDFIALNSRKHKLSNVRNGTKAGEWKNIFITMTNTTYNNITDDRKESIVGTNSSTKVSSTEYDNSNIKSSSKLLVLQNNTDNKITSEEISLDSLDTITTTTEFMATDVVNITDNLEIITTNRPNISGIRRRNNNSRLKRKRMKKKPLTIESQDDSRLTTLEYSASTQVPRLADLQNVDLLTTLEDFMPAVTEKNNDEAISTTVTISNEPPYITTEESAKLEIEEILNDSQASTRLSKILMERNMTLDELVEHRERGSSQVHLADIFHNASREPNPPEPFLSKSLIEPISKETYPLRALLEANLHDTTTKAMIVDTIPNTTPLTNIPIVMDFGNNVNENGETMGIMSLFSKYTDDIDFDNTTIKKDSQGTPYVTSIVNVVNNNTEREGRQLNESTKWNEILPIIERSNNNETREEMYVKGTPPLHEKDVDGDGLIVLEDLQHLRQFESNIESTSDERLQVPYDRTETPSQNEEILFTPPSNTKLVTIATASIIGLSLILFLLTYAIFKWKYQKRLAQRKDNFPDERIPTPVFENRKGHKNHSSMRSISPMLSSSNIYTLTTVNPKSSNDSPDYAWDDLRKPFQ